MLSTQLIKASLWLRATTKEIFSHDCRGILDEGSQKEIYNELKLIAKYNGYYCKVFLGEYISQLEKNTVEIIDELYEIYCEVISAAPLSPETPDLLKYPIDLNDHWVEIEETPKIISGVGTTGMRTWNAALLLVLFANTELIHQINGKKVVELGGGTGLVSLGIAKMLHPSHLSVTDGDSNVVSKLESTFLRNKLDLAHVTFNQYLWGQFPPPEADVVLGADIVYDPSIIDCLLDTVDEYVKKGALVLISRTERNPETSKLWIEKCESRFCRKILRVENPHSFNYPCWFLGKECIYIEELLAW